MALVVQLKGPIIQAYVNENTLQFQKNALKNKSNGDRHTCVADPV